MAGPRVHTIPPGMPFVDALAAGIRAEIGDDPLALSQATILLPTARAVRSLREAFLRQSEGRPVLLPRLTALGDVDADEVALSLEGLPAGGAALDEAPAIGSLRRQLLLTRLVKRVPNLAATTAQAARLARELGKLLDEIQTERLDPAALKALAPEDHAEHWQLTLDFLKILTEAWPAVLADEEAVDPALERDRRLTSLARAWEANPPSGPVIAAGSTGSIPATADLLKVVSRLPRGAVVLPGLDAEMDEVAWAGLDEGHPQFGLSRLLEHLEISRAEVRPWPVPPDLKPRSHPARARLIAEALRPADTTEAWRELQAVDAAALTGLRRLDAPTPQEEAGAIALLMREALEVPERTAALVTPDRGLARRVAMELRRWGVEVDDSAGRPLTETPVGSYLRLLADWAAAPAPLSLLSLAKHPLSSGGLPTAEFRRLVRDLERAALRGPRPAEGFEGLRSALRAAEDRRFDREDGREKLLAFVDRLQGVLGPLADAMAGPALPLSDWLRLHVAAAETLAMTDIVSGDGRLWRGDDGEAAARFIDELRDAGHDFPALAGPDYAAVLEALMAAKAVRPRYGLHPRLHILGLLEARLQQFDLMILGGLNETTWPPQPGVDPWMSRPMRKQFGLPSPERQLGQTAHDFAQAAGAAEVVLSRAERVEGTPTVPSRWLLRLDTVLRRVGRPDDLTRSMGELLGWQAALDRPDQVRPCEAPAPTPPVAARPRRLSVTQIETWMRDPYAVYARHVLRLSKLDPLDEDPGAADKGEFIHRALELFIEAHPGNLPGDALERLLAIGRETFAPLIDRPGVHAFWWPRFEKIAAWFIAQERERRAAGYAPLDTETTGTLEIQAPGGTFLLTAKADRIDRAADGGLVLIDYKTGEPPSTKQVELGFAPQLPLEAAIALAGGFPGISAERVAELSFWRLTGGEPAGEEKPVKGDPGKLAEEARAGLEALVAAFDDPATPYRSQPRPGWAPRYTDYAHLARVQEWSAGGGEGSE
ncbi:MAG TPA: double-strand break repair protein AddB [Azospirillaceae bacterium]|nr:double-strand break repair protein AddB [Azospirillaceae bacterium]